MELAEFTPPNHESIRSCTGRTSERTAQKSIAFGSITVLGKGLVRTGMFADTIVAIATLQPSGLG